MDNPENNRDAATLQRDGANLFCLHESGLLQCVLCRQLFDGLFERFRNEKTLSNGDRIILQK